MLTFSLLLFAVVPIGIQGFAIHVLSIILDLGLLVSWYKISNGPGLTIIFFLVYLFFGALRLFLHLPYGEMALGLGKGSVEMAHKYL